MVKISTKDWNMKIKNTLLYMFCVLLLSACAPKQPQETGMIVLAASSQNINSMILLQDKTTGDLICCSDTATSTAEECAQAFERDECYVRVKDIPSRPAIFDPLTTNTYPTRKWREFESAPRW